MKVVKADSSYVAYLSEFGSKSFIHAYQSTLPVEGLTKYTNVAFSKTIIEKEIEGSLAAYFVCLNSETNPCGYAKLIQSIPPKYIESNCRGLKNTQQSIDHIADTLGYQSPAAFSRAFKKQVGVAPAAWRAEE